MRTGFVSAGCAYLFLFLPAHVVARAQSVSDGPFFARRQSFGIVAQYSNDSSHILIGQTEQRKILNLGVSYSRRLVAGRIVNWQYDAQIFPVALESDPLTTFLTTETSPVVASGGESGAPPLVKCAPQTTTYSYSINGVTYAGSQTSYCEGRRWTLGEGMSPIGMQWNFRPRRKLQPFLAGHGGYLYTTKPVPTTFAGSFNFTFDLDAGLELYRSPSQSIRVGYLFHHISDDYTTQQNPGIDNGVFQVSYQFGR
ncbi:MAG TPA: acyloxyacyl hydrolase [Terracidiphilus sp.]|nr:acyloxyacyl hydrolase [Terracidiphilus sp.]